MKRLLITIPLVAFFISCNNVAKKKDIPELPKNSKAVQVQLIDSLGLVNLFVPLRYDTNFSWVHQSDCGKPCDKQKYRFQPKELPLMKESGFMWTELKDSVDCFTISHSMDFPFRDGDTSKRIIRYEKFKEQIKADPDRKSVV